MREEVNDELQIWPQTQLEQRSVAFSTKTFLLALLCRLRPASISKTQTSTEVQVTLSTARGGLHRVLLGAASQPLVFTCDSSCSCCKQSCVGFRSLWTECILLQACTPYLSLSAIHILWVYGVGHLKELFGTPTHVQPESQEDLKTLSHPRGNHKPKGWKADGQMLHPVSAWVENSEKRLSHSVTNSVMALVVPFLPSLFHSC